MFLPSFAGCVALPGKPMVRHYRNFYTYSVPVEAIAGRSQEMTFEPNMLRRSRRSARLTDTGHGLPFRLRWQHVRCTQIAHDLLHRASRQKRAKRLCAPASDFEWRMQSSPLGQPAKTSVRKY